MNAALGWALAALAVIAGYAAYGGPGVLLALTVVVFWLLLQFNRTVRVLRQAAGRPVGSVQSAVMLHAKLHAGMRLAKVLGVTKSLGRRVAEDPETLAWTDTGGDELRVQLQGGRVSAWSLHRATPS